MTFNPFLLTDFPNAIRNITLFPAAWGEKNSVTSSSKKVLGDVLGDVVD